MYLYHLTGSNDGIGTEPSYDSPVPMPSLLPVRKYGYIRGSRPSGQSSLPSWPWCTTQGLCWCVVVVRTINSSWNRYKVVFLTPPLRQPARWVYQCYKSRLPPLHGWPGASRSAALPMPSLPREPAARAYSARCTPNKKSPAKPGFWVSGRASRLHAEA